MEMLPPDTPDLDHADGDTLLSNPFAEAGALAATTAVDAHMDLSDADRKLAQAEWHARQLEARARSACEAEEQLRAHSDDVLDTQSGSCAVDEIGRECARRSCEELQKVTADLCSEDTEK